MMKNLFFSLSNNLLFTVLSLISGNLTAQISVFADSVRNIYSIPELAFAVISSDTIFEMHALGFKKINTAMTAELSDRFRIGSNTKAITGFIAALLVREKLINWDTKFFDLYPELKTGSNSTYHDLTLINLLSFRTRLIPWTYYYEKPLKDDFQGNEDEQRYQFASWFLSQAPVPADKSINFSNLSYVAAGLMLEKASGRSFKNLVRELGIKLHVVFEFGAPCSADPLQPWGHDENLNPELPVGNYKLNWLLAAGNINVSLPDYVKFIQLQLKGLNGNSDILSREEFNFLHFGFEDFAVGWFWTADENEQTYSYNIGNPGTFLSKVYVFKDTNRAIILFCNVQSEAADIGSDILYDKLYRTYINN